MSDITKDGLRPFDDNNTGAILAVFETLGKPKRMLDLGSGSGIMVQVANENGAKATGVDLLAEPPNIKHDLNIPLFLDRYFDMVITVETAEHLPESAADTFCKTIYRHILPHGTLVFTAAVVGQNGSGHINCQPKEYWTEKLEKLGLRYDAEKTAALAEAWYQKAGGISAWISPNLQVFNR